jgi:hypothetical protein
MEREKALKVLHGRHTVMAKGKSKRSGFEI